MAYDFYLIYFYLICRDTASTLKCFGNTTQKTKKYCYFYQHYNFHQVTSALYSACVFLTGKSNDDRDYWTVGMMNWVPRNACEQLPTKIWGFQLNETLSGKTLAFYQIPHNFSAKTQRIFSTPLKCIQWKLLNLWLFAEKKKNPWTNAF